MMIAREMTDEAHIQWAYDDCREHISWESTPGAVTYWYIGDVIPEDDAEYQWACKDRAHEVANEILAAYSDPDFDLVLRECTYQETERVKVWDDDSHTYQTVDRYPDEYRWSFKLTIRVPDQET